MKRINYNYMYFAYSLPQIFCKADRQKTNDVRQVKESYEQKLLQTSKSANVEIHRLVRLPLHPYKNIINFMLVCVLSRTAVVSRESLY